MTRKKKIAVATATAVTPAADGKGTKRSGPRERIEKPRSRSEATGPTKPGKEHRRDFFAKRKAGPYLRGSQAKTFPQSREGFTGGAAEAQRTFHEKEIEEEKHNPPPRAADLDVVVIPIYWRNKSGQRELVLPYAEECTRAFEKAGLRVWMDARNRYLPGEKMRHWEMQTPPIRFRVEIGPSEAEQQSFLLAKVHTPGKVADKTSHFKEDISVVARDVLTEKR
ncbi:Proline--tRNA ligase [Porphyridium purpureum]|uniref:Proline--tRNA ligase n=1 Tax=Porphyridium purpureum TaxID=35688 RepID=A0A5J4YLL4_PORPP|nr:Proline--tRNA ligase [Porphyridium purpureum]|eukprot:POR6360..scf295_9